jgi:hypothetical protein
MLLAVELRYVFARTLRASRSGHRFGDQEAAKAPDVGGTCKTAAVEETVPTRLTTCRPCDTFFDDHRAAPARSGPPAVIMSLIVRFPTPQMFLRTGPGQGRVRAAQRTPGRPRAGGLSCLSPLARRSHGRRSRSRGGSGHHAVLDGPAEDSALRLGAERRAGVVPGLGDEGSLPTAR